MCLRMRSIDASLIFPRRRAVCHSFSSSELGAGGGIAGGGIADPPELLLTEEQSL